MWFSNSCYISTKRTVRLTTEASLVQWEYLEQYRNTIFFLPSIMDKVGEIMMHQGVMEVQNFHYASLTQAHMHTIVTLTLISCGCGVRACVSVCVLLEWPSCSLCWKSCLFSLLTQECTQTVGQANGQTEVGPDAWLSVVLPVFPVKAYPGSPSFVCIYFISAQIKDELAWTPSKDTEYLLQLVHDLKECLSLFAMHVCAHTQV